MSFPAFKIGLLLVKHISKPIASRVKIQTQTHPQLRATVIRFAQAYHRVEVRMKRRQADLKTVGEIRPLDDGRAIDLASNFIGEGIILSVAVLAVVAEQWRKNTGEQSKAQQLEERFTSMETRLKEVELALMSASREGGVGAGSGSTSSSESAQQLTSGTLPITSTTSTTQTSPSPSLVDRVWRLASKGASEKYDEKT